MGAMIRFLLMIVLFSASCDREDLGPAIENNLSAIHRPAKEKRLDELDSGHIDMLIGMIRNEEEPMARRHRAVHLLARNPNDEVIRFFNMTLGDDRADPALLLGILKASTRLPDRAIDEGILRRLANHPDRRIVRMISNMSLSNNHRRGGFTTRPRFGTW